MTFPVNEKATKMNVWQMPESSKFLREDLVLDNGHLLDQVLKRRWYSLIASVFMTVGSFVTNATGVTS